MTARMYPPAPRFEARSEKSFVQALRDQLPDDAVVFCNVRFTDRAGDREADVIVAWPGFGVATIEVKGGSVSLREGQWWQTGAVSKAVHPVEQAKKCKYALRNYLGKHPRWARGKPRLVHLVALPTTDLPEDFAAPDAPRWLVIDRSQTPSAAAQIASALRQVENQPEPPTDDDVEALVDCLAGTLIPQADLLAHLAEREDACELLTQEQAKVLDFLSGHPRVEIRGGELGNYLPADDRRSNFLSQEAADYAARRAPVVRGEGGQLEQTRLFTNMLSSMPLCFSVFGHLRSHPDAAVTLLGALLDRDIAALDTVRVGSRVIEGIECEWAPERHQHLNDGSAFDAVVAARLADGRRLLVAVETKYVDTFSRDPRNADKDAKYRRFCRDFGMSETAFDRLGGPATRQLLRNVLLTESVRRGGNDAGEGFDEAITVVLARNDDEAARKAVAVVDAERDRMPTGVAFVGHGQLADAAAAVPELASWAAEFRRRYVGALEDGRG